MFRLEFIEEYNNTNRTRKLGLAKLRINGTPSNIVTLSMAILVEASWLKTMKEQRVLQLQKLRA